MSNVNGLSSSKPFADLVAGSGKKDEKPVEKRGIKPPMILKPVDPTEVEQQRQEIAASVLERAKLQTDIQSWVPTVLEPLSEVEAEEKKIQRATSDMERATAQAVRDGIIAKFKNPTLDAAVGQLSGYMWEDPTGDPLRLAACRGAWKGVLSWWLSREFHSKQELISCLQELAKKGELIKTPNGQLSVGRDSYNVPPASHLDEVDIVDLQKKLGEAGDRVEKQERQNTNALLTREDNISTVEMLEGKYGVYANFVPPHEVVFPDGGKAWRSGALSGNSDGMKFFPAEGTGGLRGIIALMTSKRTFVLIERLGDYLKDGKLTDEEGNSLHGYLLKILGLAIQNEKRQNERTETLQTFRQGATTEPNKWFLDGVVGSCCAEYRGRPWEFPTGEKLFNVFFLVERTEENDTRFVSVVDAPEHVKPHLPTLNEKFAEGEAFDGLLNNPNKEVKTLGVMLRAMFGQVAYAAKRAAK